LRHDSTELNAAGERRRHWLSDCRPDLLPHEPGPTCTWWHQVPPSCYADHVAGTFECTEDGPMA
jgi:hypothetical protein